MTAIIQASASLSKEKREEKIIQGLKWSTNGPLACIGEKPNR